MKKFLVASSRHIIENGKREKKKKRKRKKEENKMKEKKSKEKKNIYTFYISNSIDTSYFIIEKTNKCATSPFLKKYLVPAHYFKLR